jgi:hypothetical protein
MCKLLQEIELNDTKAAKRDIKGEFFFGLATQVNVSLVFCMNRCNKIPPYAKGVMWLCKGRNCFVVGFI